MGFRQRPAPLGGHWENGLGLGVGAGGARGALLGPLCACGQPQVCGRSPVPANVCRTESVHQAPQRENGPVLLQGHCLGLGLLVGRTQRPLVADALPDALTSPLRLPFPRMQWSQPNLPSRSFTVSSLIRTQGEGPALPSEPKSGLGSELVATRVERHVSKERPEPGRQSPGNKGEKEVKVSAP